MFSGGRRRAMTSGSNDQGSGTRAYVRPQACLSQSVKAPSFLILGRSAPETGSKASLPIRMDESV